MKDLLQPAINIADKLPVIVGIGIIISILDIVIISSLTNSSNGFSITSIFVIAIVFLLSLIVFIAACFVVISRAMIKLTDDGITQMRIRDSLFLHWDEIQEIETRFGVRLLKSSSQSMEIYLEDFKDPDRLIEYIDSRVPATIIRS